MFNATDFYMQKTNSHGRNTGVTRHYHNNNGESQALSYSSAANTVTHYKNGNTVFSQSFDNISMAREYFGQMQRLITKHDGYCRVN